MDIRVRAAVQTVGMLGLAMVSAAVVVWAVNYFSANTLMYIFGIGMLAGFFYLFYGVTLSRLQYDEAVKKTVDLK
jgi:predicted Na+-dependent transporter